MVGTMTIAMSLLYSLFRRWLAGVPALAALFMAASAAAEDGKVAGAAYTWSLTGTAQQAYDDNVFLVSGAGAAPVKSGLTSLAARLGWDGQGPKGGALETLSLSYAPEVVRYWSASSENYTAHRFAAVGKFRHGAVSANFDTTVAWIDGSEIAPYYSAARHDDQRSAYAAAAARERRRQVQAKARASLTMDRADWFCRAVASVLSCDLGTDWRAEPGYQNYVDRRDLNGGFDLGWRLPVGVSATVGYRRGYQFQQMLPSSVDRTHANASSGYDRILLGLEGKPCRSVSLSVQAGPETHCFPVDSATRVVLVSRQEQTRWFAEAGAVVSPTGAGSLSLKYKRWMWLSSTGKVPLIETTYEAAYRRNLSARYALDLGVKAASSDYRCGSGSASLRDDWMYSATAKLSANFTPRLTLAVGATQDLGRNGRDDLATVAPSQLPRLREFDRRGVSIAITFKR